MNQEALNAMMRYPWEVDRSVKSQLPKCPKCKERYCGDGVQLCVDCSADDGIVAVKQ